MQRVFFLLIIYAFFISLGVTQATPTNRHFTRAKELYIAGRWGDARFELLKAKDEIKRSNYAEHQEVDFYLSLCAIGLEDDSALKRLSFFSELYPHSPYANQVGFNKGLLLSTSQEYNRAREEFLNVDYKKLNRSQREEYDIRMGYITFLDGDYSAAKGHFDKIPLGSEYYDHSLYYRSYISYSQEDLESAKDGFTRLTQSDIYGVISPYYLLQIEFQLGNYKYVIERGEELIKKVTPEQRAEITRTMSESCFRLGDFEGAIRYISLYETFGGRMSREDSYILGFSLYRLTDYKTAQEHLRKASGADDALTQNASFHLADCYLRLGNKKGAMQAFAMASNDKYNPEIAEDALFNYGKLQFELGGGVFNEAINVLTRYINKYPNSNRATEAKKLLAAAYYNSSSYDAAYKAIKEIKSPDADIRAALQKITYFRALEAMNRGDYSLAKSNFAESQSAGISPKYSALSEFWLGEIAYFEGDYSSALKSFNTYLARAPKTDSTYAMAQYSTAYALLKGGNESAALRYFNSYLATKPTDISLRTDAQNRVGDILYGERQFAEASKSYQLSTKAAGAGGDYARYQLSMVDGIRGFTNRKISGLEAIVKADGGAYADDALYELGRTHMAQERYKEAIEDLELFISKYPASERYAQALSDLGLSYLNLGNKSASISYYDRAIKSAPQSSVSKDALQGIREIYVGGGDANGYFEYAQEMGFDSDLGATAKDSLSFASAQYLYLQEDRGRATQALASYIKEYEQGYYLTDALFLLSDCYIKKGDNDKAIESLTTLSNRGANQYTQRVLESLSRLTHNAGEYEQAAAAYRKLFDVTKSQDEKSAAMDGYAECIIALGDRDKSLAMANDILSQELSGDKAILKAKHVKATILRENGGWSEAVVLYEDLATEPATSVGAEARYYLISNAHRAGEIDQAEKMIFEFSDSGTTQAYWLARAFITLGDIYVARGDNFQARATYQSIVDGYVAEDDGVRAEAISKIEKLE